MNQFKWLDRKVLKIRPKSRGKYNKRNCNKCVLHNGSNTLCSFQKFKVINNLKTSYCYDYAGGNGYFVYE